MIYLQERDKRLLKLIGVYGIINNRTISRIYCNSKQYYIRRKKLLADARYIIKTNKYAYLGMEGKKYLESIGIVNLKKISGNELSRERLCKISEALVLLQGVYECCPSWKLKDSSRISDRKMQFYGKIRNKRNGYEYYLYNAGKLKKTKDVKRALRLKSYYIENLKDEIVQNAQIRVGERFIERVIILVSDGLTMRLYKDNLDSLGVKEQLIMPFSKHGIDLIREMGRRNLKKEAVQFLYGNNYGKPDWKYADYTIKGNKQAIVLINNDGEKIVRIKQDQQINQYNYSRRNNLVVICLESQVASFKEQFPEIEIVPLPNTFIWRG